MASLYTGKIMIKYHGTPVGGEKTNAEKILRGRHAMVSFQHPGDLPIVAQVCESFVLDNGAFSAWRANKPIMDWGPYYDWVSTWQYHPALDWALIPDVIDGDEQANDDLLAEWPFDRFGVPIWHLHESIERLERMSRTWSIVALGSSGEFSIPGDEAWFERMAQAMDAICDDDGRPQCWIHGLRMLDSDIFTKFPFKSADSTNVARNCCMNRTYPAPSAAVQGHIIASTVEAFQSSPVWIRRRVQSKLFG